ncbi:MAG: hypothetical protein CME65_07200, partial [Halobacteriovoraceae bacterium]|nr:hypothetical protein [Halobacteriovoraceae bacterium]
MSKVNLIFFKFEPQVPLITELAKLYESREDFNVEMIENAMEVNQFLMNSPQGILFFQIKSKQDLQEAVGILKSNRKAIKKGAIKPACISTIQNRKVESILAKYGCQDILDVDAKAKTLTFKLDFWSKPIKKVVEKMEREEELKLSRNNKATENQSKTQERKEFELVSPLELQSDFWLVKAKADYKRILKRYLIRLLGPSPYIGTWVELDPQPGDNQPTWKWVLKDPDNTDYVVEDGAWFFYGAKPEFDWKIKRWSFASDLPHLYFYNRDGETFSKFKMKDGVVEIADNSEFAVMREPMILETCDSKFNFEGDGQKEEESNNLDGEGSAADRFGDEPVGGKGGPADSMGNPLEGKASAADRYGDDPLSGKASTDTMGNSLEGKASPADRYGD